MQIPIYISCIPTFFVLCAVGGCLGEEKSGQRKMPKNVSIALNQPVAQITGYEWPAGNGDSGFTSIATIKDSVKLRLVIDGDHSVELRVRAVAMTQYKGIVKYVDIFPLDKAAPVDEAVAGAISVIKPMRDDLPALWRRLDEWLTYYTGSPKPPAPGYELKKGERLRSGVQVFVTISPVNTDDSDEKPWATRISFGGDAKDSPYP